MPIQRTYSVGMRGAFSVTSVGGRHVATFQTGFDSYWERPSGARLVLEMAATDFSEARHLSETLRFAHAGCLETHSPDYRRGDPRALCIAYERVAQGGRSLSAAVRQNTRWPLLRLC
jgi:hypothetical protein